MPHDLPVTDPAAQLRTSRLDTWHLPQQPSIFESVTNPWMAVGNTVAIGPKTDGVKLAHHRLGGGSAEC
jgi:hypothetical protein